MPSLLIQITDRAIKSPNSITSSISPSGNVEKAQNLPHYTYDKFINASCFVYGGYLTFKRPKELFNATY